MAIAKYSIGCLNSNTHKPGNFASMASVIASTAAFAAVAGSSVAMSAVAGSSVAMSALENSSLVVTKTNQACGTNTSNATTIYSGKCIVIYAWNSSSDGNNGLNLYVGLFDGSYMNIGNLTTAKTRVKVMKKASILKMYINYSSNLSYGGVMYIPVN